MNSDAYDETPVSADERLRRQVATFGAPLAVLRDDPTRDIPRVCEATESTLRRIERLYKRCLPYGVVRP